MTGAHQWVGDDASLGRLADELAGVEAFALDTEFHRERTYFPHLDLVQIAWPGGVALIDPQVVDLAPLVRLLEGPGLTVVHAADQDLEVLRAACGTVPTRLFDTQLAAGFLGMASASLQTLVDRFLGVRLRKGDRLTDWSRRPLGADQQAYAAADVEHLLALREIITARLSARGRLAWAEEECELARRLPRGPSEPETAWWKQRDARSLRGRSMGVAQEVAAWRERRAMAQDVPPRFVLPDLSLAAIAQRPPTTVADLSAVRGLDGRHLRSGAADEVLDAVRRGLALAPGQVRRPPVDDLDRSLRPAVALVAAWVNQLAVDLEIDPALLATRADVQAFLQDDSHGRLAQGWRRDLVGEPVRRLVDGEATLAFEGGRLVLEPRRPGGAGRAVVGAAEGSGLGAAQADGDPQ